MPGTFRIVRFLNKVKGTKMPLSIFDAGSMAVIFGALPSRDLITPQNTPVLRHNGNADGTPQMAGLFQIALYL